MPSIGLQFYNQTFYSGASIPFFKPSKNPLPFEKGFIEPNFVKINDSIGNFSIYLNTTSEKGEVKIVKIFENHSIKFTPCSQKSIQSWPLPTNSGKGISIYNESLSLLRLMGMYVLYS